MRIVVTILAVCFSLMCSAADLPLKNLRQMMADAYSDKKAAELFYKTTRDYSTSSPALLLGFKAVSELMMCNHVSGPINKLHYFNRGKDLLEKAITLNPRQVELRFMRFCTQVNTPAILAYKGDLDEDKKILLDYLKTKSATTDKDLYNSVRTFLSTSGECDKVELEFLKAL